MEKKVWIEKCEKGGLLAIGPFGVLYGETVAELVEAVPIVAEYSARVAIEAAAKDFTEGQGE